MLDPSLIQDIKRWSRNDGTRQGIRPLRSQLRIIRDEMSTHDAPSTFRTLVSRHGRGAVAVALALTITARADRLDRWGMEWAREVLSACQFHVEPLDYAWADGLHPTRLIDYTGSFVRFTTEP